jgi:hypothetical protein
MNSSILIHAGENPEVTIEPQPFGTFMCTVITIKKDNVTSDVSIFSKNDLKITLLPERKV